MIASKEVLDLIHSIGAVCFPGASGFFCMLLPGIMSI